MKVTGDERRWMLELCTKAMNIELPFEELVLAFPNGAPEGEYQAVFYEDLVDGVEHVPGDLRGRVLMQVWLTSEMYSALALHQYLLRGELPFSELARIHRLVHAAKPLARPDEIPFLVAQATTISDSSASEKT